MGEKDKLEEVNGYDLGAEEIIAPATPEDTGSEDDSGNDD